ncbi:glycosyltransferase family 4 protein [Desulfitobacterium sp. PCE1]|uniref:glycosyltransferase family 4 protein n=1 Tax=Desulfitobacterium sp. PCE1 TaxID=146907 RepID=UPI0003810B90|nr:glycosyltransferase family 4 protein [Desulfitobacterium sp. PCE1]
MNKIRTLAFISNAQMTGERGGAEIFNERMLEALKNHVPYVKHFPVPCSEETFEDILKGYLTCYDLDLREFDGVVSTKAPTFAVQHPNHVSYLIHTIRVFYDMFDEIKCDLSNYDKRKLIQHMDTELLRYPRVKKIFSIGHEVKNRLETYNGLTSEVLHLGMTKEGFYCKDYDYIFLPGRLHKWKRVDLMVKAMKYVKAPIKLKIAGTGEQMQELIGIAGDDDRIEFLGFVSDEMMKELYSNALVVIFIPIQEDYGFILHEGFTSKKPVITCTDSGEPVRFIRQGENGFIVEPEPREIAKCVDSLYENKERAKQMGQCGFETIADISWDQIAKVLLKALED